MLGSDRVRHLGMSDLGIAFKDLHTSQSSLEEIFVSLVSTRMKEREPA